ncbi:transcription antitermination factor NusB [Alteromonas lipolytica]|uniref:Transcription antitermination protein NusB n=1 Tax=Alteromonas lipolytica TaxID=1856405 RepID=A0A1E8F9A7_9ALTE|nr:transcription antitermination factor NusB [Alteromonas lipolytica]OFI32497.1 N utilization substance protein B [Alteromonas lipolytica]GGF75706.1 N utilization substance protein B [Alteromonas lipolytica]
MKVSPRRRARELALQGVYSWQMTQNQVDQVELSLATSNDMKKVDTAYFQLLLRGVVRNASGLDATIKPYLGRLPEELDPIEKAILRLATFELTEQLDVPYKVIINEAIELAKSFGAEDSHKFVNGALDKAVKTLRPHERG